MVSFFTKLALAGGAISGIFFIQGSEVNFGSLKKQIIKTQIEEINSIDDIELFEKTHGCSFVFVKSWKNPTEIYGAREYDQREKDDEGMTEKIILGANMKHDDSSEDAKNLCKRQKGVITLFEDGGAFRLGRPYGGW